MSQFRARYPTFKEQQRMQFAFHEIGSFTECTFYTSTPGFDSQGMSFCLSYNAARNSTNKKELCAYVGSMMCAVSSDLRDSVVEALHGVGVEPRFVDLPSQAHELGLDEIEVTEMDWPSILVYFGCICFNLLKIPSSNSINMATCIHELQKRVGYEPGIQLEVPFDSARENVIRTMLGASLALRSTLIKFIMGTMDSGRSSIHTVCQYLFDVLSWSGMDDLILMNEMLVIPQSSVLSDPEHSKEAEDLRQAVAAIKAHPYPQFFMHLASNGDLLKVDRSRFSTLIDIAKEMEYKKIIGIQALLILELGL